MQIKTTLLLSANGDTSSVLVPTDGYRRARIKVEVDDLTDAAGTFYVLGRATPSDAWERHPDLFQAKTAGNGLRATFDWHALCGGYVAVEYARSSGGTAQTANIYMHLA